MTLAYTTRQDGAKTQAFADHRGYRIEVATGWDINSDSWRAHLYLTSAAGVRTKIDSWAGGEFASGEDAIDEGLRVGEYHVNGLKSQQA